MLMNKRFERMNKDNYVKGLPALVLFYYYYYVKYWI